LNLTKSYDFGRYQAYLDGVKVGGEIDLFNPKVLNEECHLLDFWPDPGPHRVRLVCVGRHPQSQGILCGVESVRLRERRPRVTTLGFDRDLDWRKNPVLYQ
jgi:hypothetical protein